MALTKLDLETLLADDIDHVDGAGSMTALMYINNAGLMLCNMYGWRWADRMNMNLNLVPGQSWIPLPEEVLRIHSITSDDPSRSVVMVDHETFMLNENLGSQPNGYYAFYAGSVGGSGQYVKNLILYPVPPTPTTEKLVLKYKAGWRPIVADTDQASVPDFIEPLYLEVLRAYYMGWEEDGNGGVTQRMELVKNGQAYRDAVAIDINMVPYETPIPGSGGRSYEPNHTYNDLPT